MRHRALAMLPLLIATVTMRLGAQSEAPPRTSQDSMILRARKLADDGNGADGRKLLDSVLKTVPVESDAFAEALYWRAAIAPVAVDAERDYRRLLVEAPLSTRAEDAMLQLAQLEQARGDRRAATEHLQRFVLSYPSNPARPRVVVSLVRLLFDQGQSNRGCDALRLGREIVPQSNLELRNQLEFYAPKCVVLETAPPPAEATTGTPHDSASRSPAPSSSDAGPAEKSSAADASFYSVQVAAYDSPEPASRMARSMKARGHEARVDGTTRPYRVRIGRYGTRAAAVKALAALKQQGIGGFVTLVKTDRQDR